ncbi:3'-5' exoribonuclease [Pseudoxanthomonas suwonensis]|uniref:Uncharacterized protein n=1 Tax=Pseudoxanthomonas suwonensis TaxID=314722 RepID=A0A0E3Z3G2_9GAMM|nr:3'-5' exoribonuclease [Pseudoxanthomonas suwonensis]AKC88044.1 hypothetical protein WQ53_15990 [Pseudoxanthomonas suwonensis]
MYFFLDTEWADTLGSELVSIALVSEDGGHRFYAERDPLPATPTDFAQHVVYPLLERGRAAMTDQAMTTGLRTFLGADPEPVVLADYPNDFSLLRYVLEGFELPDEQAAACGPIPQPVMSRMLKEGAMGMLVEDYFAAHPEAAARRHHALVDAEALRQAWLAVTGHIPPPAWARTLTLQKMQPGQR